MDIRFEGLELRAGAFRLAGTATLQGGAVTAVIGPSGTGKSLLLATIAGFHAAEAGTIRIGGHDMAGLAPGQRPVTALFQEGNLFPELTVARNAGLGLRPSLRLTPQEDRQVVAMLERLGLDGKATQRAASLSGGEAGRAALARVLLSGRKVLLLDEPFAALGPAMRRDLLSLVAEVQRERGLTVLMVTHNPADARQIASEVLVLSGGRIAQPGPVADLLDNPAKELAAYLGSGA